MSAYQTYLKDCDCSNGGIIIYDYKAICRWCRKPYAQGGVINYEKEHFEEVKPKMILYVTTDNYPILNNDEFLVYYTYDHEWDADYSCKANIFTAKVPCFVNQDNYKNWKLHNKPISISFQEISNEFNCNPKNQAKYFSLYDFFKSKIKL